MTSKTSSGLLVLFLIGVCTCSSITPSKQLAGPPSEFSLHSVPLPYSAGQLQTSAMFPINLQEGRDSNGNTVQVWKHELLVDSKDSFSVSVMTPLNEFVDVTLRDPNGRKVDLEKHANMGMFPVGDFGYEIPETTYMFQPPYQTGTWHIKIEVTAENQDEYKQYLLNKRDIPRADSDANGYIILWNNDTIKMYTHVNSYNLRTDSEIGLMTTVTQDTQINKFRGVNPALDAISVVEVAMLDVVMPDGSEQEVLMHDDGQLLDVRAGDMIYAGTIDAKEPGTYKAQAVLRGVRADGTQFVRTSQHIINVVTDDLTFGTSATGVLKDDTHMDIQIALQVSAGYNIVSHRTYAELWGYSTVNTSNPVPICWLSSIGELQSGDNGKYASLELDLNWLAYAQAQGPLTLRNLYIQDVNNFVPLSQSEEIAVSTPALSTHMKAINLPIPSSITKEMRQGRMPELFKNRLQKRLSGEGKSGVILLHGYCSETNPWQTYSEDWEDAYYFVNPGASISNDEFAKLVAEFAESNGLTSYSVVGHSQGGMVATHLLNYYFSGMDVAQEGRRVQSVGTPYQGATAAGSVADLGAAFGVGCGSNFDLSKDGANLWIGGISTEARKDVYYYTTTYEQGKLLGDWCNIAVNTLLKWPNDGATEYELAHLSGANNMGNTQKQCHTTGMKYDAQYYDRTRNQQMNNQAAK